MSGKTNGKLNSRPDTEPPSQPSQPSQPDGSQEDVEAPRKRPRVKRDPGGFIVPARDHQGHTVRVFCSIQPTIDHEIDCIMSSHNWPFKTKGDFIRWAIVDGVRKMETMEPVRGSMAIVAETILEACRSAQLWLKFRSSLETTEQTVKSMIDGGSEQEALKLLSKLHSEVLKMDEDAWRGQYLEEFEKKFGHVWTRNHPSAASLARMQSDPKEPKQ
jgi:hypothetical protein